MKVVLLENIKTLGRLGDIVNVRPGFARNYLLPQSKANYASKQVLADFEQYRDDFEKRQNAQLEAFQKAHQCLAGYVLQLSTRASPDGNLYGSVTAQIIARAVNDAKLEDVPTIKRNQIILSEGTIKTLGLHPVNIQLHADIIATIQVDVNTQDIDATAQQATEENT